MQTNPSNLEIHRAEPILVIEYVRLAEAKRGSLGKSLGCNG
jgi:hypothetical protein